MNDHPLVGIWPLKQAGPGRVINPYTKRAIKVGGATHTSVVQQLSVSANNPPVAAPPPKEKKLRKKPQLTERARPKKVKLAERMQAAEKSRAGLLKGRAPRPPKLSPVATTGGVSAIDARLMRAEENRQGAAAEKAARLEQAATRRAQAQAYRAEVAEMQHLLPPVLPPPPQAALWGTSPAAGRPSFNTRNLAAEDRRKAALEQKRDKARAKAQPTRAPLPAQDMQALKQQAAAERRGAALAEKRSRARAKPRLEVQPMEVDTDGRLYAAELRRQDQAAREMTKRAEASGKRKAAKNRAQEVRDAVLKARDLEHVQMIVDTPPVSTSRRKRKKPEEGSGNVRSTQRRKHDGSAERKAVLRADQIHAETRALARRLKQVTDAADAENENQVHWGYTQVSRHVKALDEITAAAKKVPNIHDRAELLAFIQMEADASCSRQPGQADGVVHRTSGRGEETGAGTRAAEAAACRRRAVEGA